MSTLVVTNLNDGGAGSLRGTIAASSTGDTITFDPSLLGGTLVLTGGELAVTSNLIIDGDTNADNRTDIRIDGDLASRVFHVTAGTSTFHAVTVTGGYELAADGGGFAIDAGSTVTIADSIVANNHVAGYGGGIANAAPPTL